MLPQAAGAVGRTMCDLLTGSARQWGSAIKVVKNPTCSELIC